MAAVKMGGFFLISFYIYFIFILGYYEQDYSRAPSTQILFILGRYHHLKTSPLLSSLSTLPLSCMRQSMSKTNLLPAAPYCDHSPLRSLFPSSVSGCRKLSHPLLTTIPAAPAPAPASLRLLPAPYIFTTGVNSPPRFSWLLPRSPRLISCRPQPLRSTYCCFLRRSVAGSMLAESEILKSITSILKALKLSSPPYGAHDTTHRDV